ncbi:MAG: acetate/propionate family kinase [Candidatus Omnitrophota bacterium]
MSVNILMFNCGSTSLRYRIISMPGETEILAGKAERIGMKTQESALINHYYRGRKRTITMDLPDHAAAFLKAMDLIREDAAKDPEVRFDAFAHRYVHPGSYFTKTTKVDKIVLRKLKDTLELAPIHNPTSYKLIDLCDQHFPQVQQLIVFDNSFHSTIPKELSTYALPARLTKKYGLKKVGFHGISHEYAMQEACKLLGSAVKEQRIISCHLSAGGSSICAIDRGKSINNSMGFTPLEGLIMNTRSGDLDLGTVFYIMSRENFSADDIETILNKKSGILGIFKYSSDLRDVIKNMETDPAAKMAFSMYVKRVRKYISFYMLLLKKADALVFTDDIGMGFPVVRRAVCEGLGFYGLELDQEKNTAYVDGLADISTTKSQTRIIIVPINEELMIARQAYKAYEKTST